MVITEENDQVLERSRVYTQFSISMKSLKTANFGFCASPVGLG